MSATSANGYKTVRIALLQHPCGPDTQANVDTTIGLIRRAAADGAQVIATQELFNTTYFPQIEDAERFRFAEPIPGPTTDRLCRLAGELDIELTASLFEKRAAGIYHNTSVLISPENGGAITARYRKMHIPDDPRFYEKFYFTPGDPPGPADPTRMDGETNTTNSGWCTAPTRHTRVGLLICWDQWFPEAARLTALAGAQILFYPTAIGYSHDEPTDERERQLDAWRTIQRSHAIANGVFVAAVNRVGTEGDITFWGSSFIADPGGRVIAQAPAEGEHVLTADCDLSQIDEAREGWPFLRDRRTDAYTGLLRRYLDD